jgi:hypothetical protein
LRIKKRNLLLHLLLDLKKELSLNPFFKLYSF